MTLKFRKGGRGGGEKYAPKLKLPDGVKSTIVSGNLKNYHWI